MRLQFWFDPAFRLARNMAGLAVATLKSRKHKLARDLDAILASAKAAPRSTVDTARIIGKLPFLTIMDAIAG